MPNSIVPPRIRKSIKQPAPAFQFYARDWISDAAVLAMSCAERGAYINLLAVCWMEESLPLDPCALRRIAGAEKDEWATIEAVVLARFYVHDGTYRNKRLDEERLKQRDFSKLQSHRARSRNAAGCQPERSRKSAGSQPKPCSASASASASASSEVSTPAPVDADFTTFQSAYPHGPNVGTFKHAAKVWGKLTDAQRQAALDALPAYAASEGATKEGGRYVPTPQKWLSDEWWLKPITGTARTSRLPTQADAYGWCEHVPRCGTEAGHAIRLAREAREQAVPA